MKKLIIFTVLFFSLQNNISAQNGIVSGSASGLGIAGSNGASLSGWEATLINPAALTSKSTSFPIDFTVFSGGGLIGNNNFTFDLYNSYFTGDANGNPYDLEKNPAAKQEILSAFDPELKGFSKAQIIPLAVSYHTPSLGSFSFIIMTSGSGRLSLPKDFAQRTFVAATEIGKTTKINDLVSKGMFRNEYILGYAHPVYLFRDLFDEVSFGGALKFETGLAYGNLEIEKDEISTSSDGVITHKFKYSGKLAGNDYFRAKVDKNALIEDPGYFFFPAGYGLGLDFGVSARTNSGYKFFFSVTDLGWITWNKNTVSLKDENEVIISHYNPDREGVTGSDYADSLFAHYNPKRDESGFSTVLPTTINVGISFPIDKLPIIKNLYYPGKLTGHFSVHEGLNEEAGNTFIPRVAAGVDWMLFEKLDLRTGLSFGGVETFNWGFGVGYRIMDFVQVDAGTANFHQLFLGDSKTKFSASFNLRWFVSAPAF